MVNGDKIQYFYMIDGYEDRFDIAVYYPCGSFFTDGFLEFWDDISDSIMRWRFDSGDSMCCGTMPHGPWKEVTSQIIPDITEWLENYDG